MSLFVIIVRIYQKQEHLQVTPRLSALAFRRIFTFRVVSVERGVSHGGESDDDLPLRWHGPPDGDARHLEEALARHGANLNEI